MAAFDPSARILAERYAEEAAERERKARLLAMGPLTGSGISPAAWRDWHRYGFVVCPGRKGGLTCTAETCGLGTSCTVMAAKGLKGNAAPLPRSERPACGARTRAGGECAMRVEPGRHRCRLHGGRSTGPKTAEGKALVAEAQRARWRRWRESHPSSG